jgi:hypothetical protein
MKVWSTMPWQVFGSGRGIREISRNLSGGAEESHDECQESIQSLSEHRQERQHSVLWSMEQAERLTIYKRSLTESHLKTQVVPRN